MKISSRSTRPTSERSSWRWVPSPQSNSSLSPPRLTRVAAGARCAVGADPDVPRKTTSRFTSERQVGVHHLALEQARARVPGEEDRVPPLEWLPRRLVLEPAPAMRGRHPCLLTDSLRADHDVVEVEVDVGEGGQKFGVEARRAVVTLPARAGAGDLVDAVLGQRRDQAGEVAFVLCDRVPFPQLPDLLVFGGIDRSSQQIEDALARHRAPFTEGAPIVCEPSRPLVSRRTATGARAAARAGSSCRPGCCARATARRPPAGHPHSSPPRSTRACRPSGRDKPAPARAPRSPARTAPRAPKRAWRR